MAATGRIGIMSALPHRRPHRRSALRGESRSVPVVAAPVQAAAAAAAIAEPLEERHLRPVADAGDEVAPRPPRSRRKTLPPPSSLRPASAGWRSTARWRRRSSPGGWPPSSPARRPARSPARCGAEPFVSPGPTRGAAPGARAGASVGGGGGPARQALGRVLAERRDERRRRARVRQLGDGRIRVRAADTRGAGASGPVRLRLAGESRAGTPAAARARAGEAYVISTGAMVPAGADAVVRVEDTDGGRRTVSTCGARSRRAPTSAAPARTSARATRARAGRAARAGGARGGGLDRRADRGVRAAPAVAFVVDRRRADAAGRAAAAGRRSATRTRSRCRRRRAARAPTTSRAATVAPTTSRPRSRCCGGRWTPTSRDHRRGLGRPARPRQAGAGRAGRRGGLLGSGAAPRQADLVRGRAGARRWSSACRATRCRRWSRSTCSCGPALAAMMGASRASGGPRRCSTPTTASSPAGRTSCAAGWRPGATGGTCARRRRRAHTC